MAITQADIQSWTIHNELRGGPTAEIVVDNSSGAYDDAIQRETVQIAGNYTGDSSTVLFNGLISEVQPAWGADGEQVSILRCVSPFRSLEEKPVNTEYFATIRGYLLMTRIAEEYGAVDGAFVNIVEDNSTTLASVLVSSDSVVDVLRKIARVCQVELFFKQGELVTELYKTSGSSVDYVFAAGDLDHVEQAYTELTSNSCVVVRGRWEWERLASPITIFSDSVTMHSIYELHQVTYHIPLDQAYDLNALSTAVITVSQGEVTSYGPLNSIGDWMYVTVKDFSTDLANVPVSVTISIKPLKQNERSGRNHTSEIKPALSNMYGIPVMGTFRGQNLIPRVAAMSLKIRKHHSDEDEDDRLTVRRCSATLVARVGVRYAEEDNPYVFSETNANGVGDRILQEILQGTKRWELRGPWNNNVGVNSKVTFPIGDTGDTADGVIISEDLSWEADTGAIDATYTVEEL